MTVLLAVLGGLLVGLAVLDAFTTAATAGQGAGPVTRRVSSGVHRLLLRLARGASSRWLAVGGPLSMLTTVVVWVLLLWLGWSLVFSATDLAVVDATTKAPASVAGRVYYAGFVIFTLGVGDLVAGSGLWQVFTAFASFVGLAVVTLAITFLVSVVSAAVARRRLAVSVSLLGERGPDVVRLHWDGEAFSSGLASRLSSVEEAVLQTAQQHLAYPVLHYFRATQDSASTPRALAVLDDALVLLDAAVAPSARPAPDVLVPLRRCLEHYATTVQTDGASDAGPPPLPDPRLLREAGVPLVDDHAYRTAALAHTARREALHALVRSDARDWPAS